MLNKRTLPISSRTRSKEVITRLKRKKATKLTEDSKKDSAPVQILTKERQENVKKSQPDIICLGSDSDDGDHDDTNIDYPTESSDESLSDSDDLEFHVDPEESECSESSSSSEEGKQVSNGSISEDDFAVAKDVIKLTSSKTKSRKEWPASYNSKQPSRLLSDLADTILEKQGSDLNTLEEETIILEENPLPQKFTFPILPEETEVDEEMDCLWSEMQFCSRVDEDEIELTSSKTKPNASKKRRRSSSSSKQLHLLSVLTDTILDKQVSDSNPFGETLIVQQDVQETSLPLKFTFGVEEKIIPEKTESEKEMDALWSEMHEDVIELTSSKTKPNASKKGRPSSSSSKQLHLLSLLTDTILDKQVSDSNPFEETLSVQQDVQETSLPLKFTFGAEEKLIPEKTESEKEMDALWSEMHFCSEIDSNPTPVENVEDDFSEFEHDGTTLSQCLQGKHYLVLDEEVGMKCKYCSFLMLEIKYISAPFMTDPCGKYERYLSGVGDSSLFDGLLNEDPNDMPALDHSANTEGTVWEIIPNLRSQLYPHQHEGFEFIWNNIAGGIYRDKSKNSSKGGGGCIISHAPGTGKTLLTIVFLQTYLKEYPSCRPVIIAPRSMLLTWEEEFRKWKVDIPFHNLNTPDFSGKDKLTEIGLFEKFKQGVPPQDQVLARRLVKLLSWKSDGGILGISYTLFEQLVGKDNKEKHQCRKIDKHVSKILLELPGLFVLDEGHTPRNDDSLMWKALTRIKTERRIILSGTPFQNNFDELFNTLCLVRPKFAEGIQSRHRLEVNRNRNREENEAKRKWASLTDSIGKDDIHEAEKLRELKDVIKPFVHVHKGTILQTTLPGLRHSVVVLQPSDLQNRIIECVKETNHPFLRDYYVSLFSTHPSLLQQLSNNKDIKEKVSSIVSMDELERIRLKPDKGVKTKFLMELVKLSGALDERVIVFSQYLEPLILILEQLKDFFKWKEMKEILYMHGNCNIKERQRLITLFNDPTSNARVLLASTRACSEGINLIGGSRVVLLDVTWNPSVERQAICRAYRLGQKKVVYTYHLISSGTMEGLKCYRQAGKDRLSELLFSSSHKSCNDHHENGCNVLEDKILEAMAQQEKFTSMIEKIIDQPKDSDFIGAYEGL